MSEEEGPKGAPKPARKGKKTPKKRSRSIKVRARAGEKGNFDPDRTASAKILTLTDIQREAKMGALLERLAEKGEEITQAAKALGIARTSLYGWRERFPHFDGELMEAYRTGTEAIAEVARSRAVEGWEEPVYQQGKLVGTVRRYDHNLLLTLLRKRDPGYRDPKYDRPVTPPADRDTLSVSTRDMPAALLEQLEAWASKQQKGVA